MFIFINLKWKKPSNIKAWTIWNSLRAKSVTSFKLFVILFEEFLEHLLRLANEAVQSGEHLLRLWVADKLVVFPLDGEALKVGSFVETLADVCRLLRQQSLKVPLGFYLREPHSYGLIKVFYSIPINLSSGTPYSELYCVSINRA